MKLPQLIAKGLCPDHLNLYLQADVSYLGEGRFLVEVLCPHHLKTGHREEISARELIDRVRAGLIKSWQP